MLFKSAFYFEMNVENRMGGSITSKKLHRINDEKTAQYAYRCFAFFIT